jgi:SAM-dependent methyltransferase
MTDEQIRFDDGLGYEQYMGRWSRLVGEEFLRWLSPAHGLRWLDVGCGNGAFTELLVQRCAPAFVDGIDPSEAQLTFARARLTGRPVSFQRADAMALPIVDNTMDAAVMPLVIFFVPDPARGVAEMARAVRPGGLVAAYAWDIAGGGLPFQSLREEMQAMGIHVPLPPSPGASRLDILQELWSGAGIVDLETSVIVVERTFADFDEYWTTVHMGPTVASALRRLPSSDSTALEQRMRAVLTSPASDRICERARAHAIRGRVTC